MVNKMNWMNTSQFVLFNCLTHLWESWQERCSSCCKPLQPTTVFFLQLIRLPSPFDHVTICLTVNSHFSSRYWNTQRVKVLANVQSVLSCFTKVLSSMEKLCACSQNICVLSQKLMCSPNLTLHSLTKALKFSPPHHFITFPSQMFCEWVQSFSRGHILQEIHLREIIFSSHLNFINITMSL